MKNFTDVWQVILDDNARPLIGKIEFCEPNTTRLKTIYDIDGNPTDNPIYVNKVTTNQLLLDGDYTVRFWRYIGKGIMEGDNSESSWFNYKTELVIEDSNNDIEHTESVNNISELKELEPIEGKVVRVDGYYNLDDCPVRFYVWHNEISENDGGIFISSNKTTSGSWVMKIPGTYIDVRWYGDIPDSVKNPSVSQQKSNIGQRSAAADAANMFKKDLYFPSGYYIFDGSNTVAVDKDIICDNGVSFVVKSGTTGTRVTCHELHKCDNTLFISNTTAQIGGYEFICDWIKTSWFAYSTPNATGARIGYIIDADSRTSPLSFSNTKVNIESTNSFDVSFDNVEIVSGLHLLSRSVTVQHMLLKQDWFTEDYDYSNLTVLQGCDVRLNDCIDADNYIMMKNKCNRVDYGDLGEQTIHNAVLKPDCIVNNCQGSVILDGTGNYEFHNVSLDISGVDSSKVINAVDSWLTLEGTVIDSLSLLRGSLTSTGLQVLTLCNISDADIYAHLSLYGTDIDIERCDVHGIINIVGHKDFMIRDCRIYSTITYSCDSNVMEGKFIGNYFAKDSSGIVLSSTIPDTLINCAFMNNNSDMPIMFISIDRTNIEEDEKMHGYEYSGNTGTNVLQKGCNINFVCTLRDTQGPSDPHDSLYYSESGYRGPSALRGLPPVTDESIYVHECSLFSIGTKNIEFIGKGLALLNGQSTQHTQANITSSEGYVTSEEWIPNPSTLIGNFSKDIYFVDGYVWRFRGFRNAPVFDIDSSLPDGTNMAVDIILTRI